MTGSWWGVFRVSRLWTRRKFSWSAMKLRRRGGDAGGSVQFDFSTVPGKPMSEFQQPWSLCDPDAAVAFVVIPAYTVDGRHLSEQVVFHAGRAGCVLK
jgi:hypothetical protein